MLARLLSFMIGVGIMTVFLGGGLIAFRTLTGSDGDGGPQLPMASDDIPAIASTAVLSAAPSATVVPQTSPSTNVPVVPDAPASPTATMAAPTATPPATIASLPDRYACDAIRGTSYRSEAERAFFEDNCQSLASAGLPTNVPPTSVPPTTAPPAIVATQAPEQPTATTPPTSVPPTSIPTSTANPARERLESLTAQLSSAASQLASNVGSANFNDSGWLERARQASQRVENASGAISAFDPPSCLRTAFSTLRAAASEASTANGFISSGLDAADASLLQTGATRLAGARSSLAVVPAGLAGAAC